MNAVTSLPKSNIPPVSPPPLPTTCISSEWRFTIASNSFCHFYFIPWTFCDTVASISIYISFPPLFPFSLYFRIYIQPSPPPPFFSSIWRYSELLQRHFVCRLGVFCKPLARVFGGEWRTKIGNEK